MNKLGTGDNIGTGLWGWDAVYVRCLMALEGLVMGEVGGKGWVVREVTGCKHTCGAARAGSV